MDAVDCSHDHVVLLVTTAQFENPPSWLTDNFTIIEGGTHAGGSSRNKLIIFKDGTYLELFNWIKEPTEFLQWSGKEPGCIDFALTTMTATATENFDVVSQRLRERSGCNLDLTYLPPKAGGRKRKDGQDVKWEVTRPQNGSDPSGRTDVPFFCHDITDRVLRVPFDDAAITNHSCGATGIAEIVVGVPDRQRDNYIEAYRCVTGASESDGKDGTFFALRSPTSAETEARISIQATPSTTAEVLRLILHTTKSGGHGSHDLPADDIKTRISLSR